MRTCNSRALAAVLCLACASAAAQDEEQTAQARSLFEEGVAASDRGDWEGATDHFRRSLALRGSPVVSFNLAMALARTGHLVEAQEHFRRALADERAPAAVRAAAEAQISRLGERIGRLAIHVEGPREGVVLELDGEALPDALIGTAAPSDPGRRVLVAIRGGAEIARGEAEVPEGGDASIALAIPALEIAAALPAPSPVVPRDAPEPRREADDALWIGVGVAAGVALVSAIVGLTAFFVMESRPPAPVEGNLGPTVIIFD